MVDRLALTERERGESAAMSKFLYFFSTDAGERRTKAAKSGHVLRPHLS